MADKHPKPTDQASLNPRSRLKDHVEHRLDRAVYTCLELPSEPMGLST